MCVAERSFISLPSDAHDVLSDSGVSLLLRTAPSAPWVVWSTHRLTSLPPETWNPHTNPGKGSRWPLLGSVLISLWTMGCGQERGQMIDLDQVTYWPLKPSLWPEGWDRKENSEFYSNHMVVPGGWVCPGQCRKLALLGILNNKYSLFRDNP